jgi:hypothetical protein
MSSPSTDATPRGGPRYVVTLQTSSMPMPVLLARGLVFSDLSVFRSRTVEDGRERFRLHLGYFGSITDAETVLAQVRSRYPTALVTNAPVESSGSLDDTMNTAFTLVRDAVARLVEPEPLPPTAPQSARPDAAGVNRALTPGEVASVMAPQRYAVQLDWSLQPIDAATIPRLGIFRAYSLYAVKVLRQGSAEYGLRLGFFKNLDGARQVADYVRHAFRLASVVPVSYREYVRATELTRPATAASAADAPSPQSDAAAASASEPGADGRTRAQLLSLPSVRDTDTGRDPESRVTLTAEERDMLTGQPQRGLRR